MANPLLRWTAEERHATVLVNREADRLWPEAALPDSAIAYQGHEASDFRARITDLQRAEESMRRFAEEFTVLAWRERPEVHHYASDPNTFAIRFRAVVEAI